MTIKTVLRSGVIILCLVFMLNPRINAQDNISIRNALGLRFVDTQNFSLLYKKQVAPQRFNRLSLAFFRLDISNEGTFEAFQWGAGFNFGKLRHTPLQHNFDLYHGLEYGFSTSSRIFGNDYNFFHVGLNLGYVLGAEFRIKNQIGISLEIKPILGVSYAHQSSAKNQWRVFTNGNLSNVAVNFQYYFPAAN